MTVIRTTPDTDVVVARLRALLTGPRGVAYVAVPLLIVTLVSPRTSFGPYRSSIP